MVEKIKEEIIRKIDEYGKNIPRSPDYDICIVLRDIYLYIEELEGKEVDIDRYLNFLDKYKK